MTISLFGTKVKSTLYELIEQGSIPNMAEMVLVKPHSVEKKQIVSANGESISLAVAPLRSLIVSISSRNGHVIRHAHRWLRYLCGVIGKSVTASTVEQYGRSVTYFCNWIEESERYPSLTVDEVIEIVTREDILEWHDFQKAKGTCKNSTLHSREAALKEFLTWLTTSEGGQIRNIANSPWGRNNDLDYIIKKGNKKSPKIITTEHITNLLLSMHNECERSMFHTQYDTGLRITELIGLKCSDLPPESIYSNQNYEFIPLYIRGAKGRATGVKERVTIISRAVLNRIRRYHSSSEYKLADAWKINDPNKPVFLTSNGKPWSQRNASKQFKSAVQRSGVGNEFSTHWMRHGTAFSILNSDIGKDYEDKMLTIQGMLGHANLGTTEIYTQISPALLGRINKEGINQNRLHEAEDIRKATFLPPLKHSEKRGHRGE